ncbi:hypothetical protein NEAUS07_0349 [Nematocida ausubeli]|nr:hypothetical protein NEAUS07_0349 [Nematocida ausubeli]
MGLIIKNGVKAISDGRVLEAIVWLIFMPLTIIIEVLIVQFSLNLMQAFRRIRQVARFRKITVKTNETFNDPKNAYNNLTKALEKIISNIYAAVKAHAPFLDIFSNKEGDKGSNKENNTKDSNKENEKKKTAKSYSRKEKKRGSRVKAVIIAGLEMLESIYGKLIDKLLSLVGKAIIYCICGVLVMLVITVNVLMYFIKYAFNIMRSMLEKIPFVGDFIKEIPKPSYMFQNIADELSSIIYPDEDNCIYQMQKNVIESHKTKKESLSKIMTSYVDLCILITANIFCILIRTIGEIGTVICDGNNYTVFTVGILSILAGVCVLASPSIVNPQDYSMLAQKKPLWIFAEKMCLLQGLFFASCTVGAVLYCISLLKNKEMTEQSVRRNAKSEREEFKFVVLNMLAVVCAFFACSALGNVLIAGPADMFSTLPGLFVYAMIIGAVIDIKNILYKVSISQVKQLKGILVSVLVAAMYYASVTSSIQLVPCILLAVALCVCALPVPKNKDDILPFNNKKMRIQQVSYLVVRLVIIGALIMVAEPSVATVVFRPFLYANLLVKWAYNGLIATGAFYVFEKV